MGIDINSLNTLAQGVSKYAKACGVKSIWLTKPSSLKCTNIFELNLKPLTKDLQQISNPSKNFEVKVFNSLSGKLKKGEKLISPKFNGCHGVAVYTSNGNFLFHHFPPSYKDRLTNNLKQELSTISNSEAASISFISPVSKNGLRETAFEEYQKIIKEKFSNCTFKYLDYPNRTKGGSYTYSALININGKVSDKLLLVKR